MISYQVELLEPPTHITFLIDGNVLERINIKEMFPEYCVLPAHEFKKYFVDIETNELKIIDNIDELLVTLRGPTFGNINYDGKYYRPAIQSDIDKNEEKYNSENWKLYQYLDNYYKTYEIFLSKDQSISVHIRKSDDEKDLILMRFEKDERNNFKRVSSLNLEYAVRELQYCKGYTLRKKYEELIVKNLDSVLIKKQLLPYVEGVFKPTKNKYEYDYDSD